MINTKKKITKYEIDFAIKRLLQTTRENVEITMDVKKEIKLKGGVTKVKILSRALIESE